MHARTVWSLDKALPTTRSSTLDLMDNNARAKTKQPKAPLTRVTVRQQLTRYYLTTNREACGTLQV